MNDMSNIPVAWRAWLPESALGQASIDQALSDVARHWSVKWLARKSLRSLGALANAAALPGDGSLRWTALENDAAIAVSSAAADRLAMLMLGETVLPTALNDVDRRVLDGLVEDAIQDFCRRIAEVLGLSPDTRWQDLGEGTTPPIDRPRTCQFGIDAATPLLHIALATDGLIALAKARAARSPMRHRLKPVATGLALQQVDVSASLGRCSLTLADLANLGVGDVLLLDQATEAPLTLALNGAPARRGKCAVQRDGDNLALKILEPLIS